MVIVYIKLGPGKFVFPFPAPNPVFLSIFGVGGPELSQIARVLIKPVPGMFVASTKIIGVLFYPSLL